MSRLVTATSPVLVLAPALIKSKIAWSWLAANGGGGVPAVAVGAVDKTSGSEATTGAGSVIGSGAGTGTVGTTGSGAGARTGVCSETGGFIKSRIAWSGLGAGVGAGETSGGGGVPGVAVGEGVGCKVGSGAGVGVGVGVSSGAGAGGPSNPGGATSPAPDNCSDVIGVASLPPPLSIGEITFSIAPDTAPLC